MKTLKTIFCTCLIMMAMFSYAQEHLPPLSVKSVADIKYYITKNYKVDERFIDTACINTVVVVKFKIKNDRVDSLTFSYNAPVEIKKALKDAVLSTNGIWRSTALEKAKMKDNTYLLPVVFYYQLGCTPGGQLLTSISADNKPDLSLILRQSAKDAPLHSGLQNMLKFEDGSNYSNLNCVLISPLTIGRLD